MDSFTYTITLVVGIIMAIVSIVIVAGAIYAIGIWYPRQINQKVAALKAAGRQGEATILRLPESKTKRRANTDALYTFIEIGLEIRVPGFETFEIDKVFTIPTSFVSYLEIRKKMPVWIDPQAPRNPEKIVIHIE